MAFTGRYEGNTDVFVVPAGGGVPTRLTWHPGNDVAQPCAFGRQDRREEANAMQPALASPMSARLVAIGAGTGGTQALRALLRAMPPASPGS